jgi:Na+-translocating ferredoxin:NAD+ oxidoreductase subunit A
MPDLLLIVIGTVLVNHFVLLRGSPPPSPDSAAIVFATAVAVAWPSVAGTLMTAVVMLPLERLLLTPLHGEYLRLLALVGTSAVATRSLAWLRRPTVDSLAQRGHELLIMSNCAVLVLGLGQATQNSGFMATLGLSVGLAAAFGLMLLALTELFARIDHKSLPRPFRGAPIVLICASLAALALLGLTGLLAG